MSPYDDSEYRVHQCWGPIFGSLASAALKLTNTANLHKTSTSANLTDRVEFFRNIKLTAIRVITRSWSGLLNGASSDNSPKVIVTEGTRVCGTCAIGTVAGVGTSGGISSTYPNIDNTEELQLKFKATNDATAGTFDSGSVDVYLEYQHRM